MSFRFHYLLLVLLLVLFLFFFPPIDDRIKYCQDKVHTIRSIWNGCALLIFHKKFCFKKKYLSKNQINNSIIHFYFQSHLFFCLRLFTSAYLHPFQYVPLSLFEFVLLLFLFNAHTHNQPPTHQQFVETYAAMWRMEWVEYLLHCSPDESKQKKNAKRVEKMIHKHPAKCVISLSRIFKLGEGGRLFLTRKLVTQNLC